MHNGNELGQRSGSLVCTVHNGNGLDQRSGTDWYVPCIAVMDCVRGQVLTGMYRS